MKLYDVVVVGGGPTGSYAACRLAEEGCRVVVLEQKRKVGEPVCCTGIISQECVNLFAIEDSVVLRQVNAARLFSPSGNVLRLWREETQACILDRAAFNVAMARRAQKAGAEYILNSPVKDIAIERDKVSVEVSHQGGELNFGARAAIIANGFGSRLCEKLGLGSAGDFTAGAQAEVETVGVDEVEIYFGREIAPGFFAWLVPTSPAMVRVGLMSRKAPRFYLGKLMASLLAQRKIASSGVEPSYAGVPLKPLSRTYGERLMVIGDAAGQVKPTSGGGIYYGLLCADIAASTLHQALEDGDLSAKRLSRYERGWKKKLGREMKTGYWARKLFERLSDRQIDRIFEVVKANGIDEALLKARDLSFDWHSQTILRMVGYQVVFKALGMVKNPFRNS